MQMDIRNRRLRQVQRYKFDVRLQVRSEIFLAVARLSRCRFAR